MGNSCSSDSKGSVGKPPVEQARNASSQAEAFKSKGDSDEDGDIVAPTPPGDGLPSQHLVVCQCTG